MLLLTQFRPAKRRINEWLRLRTALSRKMYREVFPRYIYLESVVNIGITTLMQDTQKALLTNQTRRE